MWNIRCEAMFEVFCLLAVWCNWLEGVTLCILMSYAANEQAERKHLKGHTVYHTAAAKVVGTINSATFYLEKVLSDLLPLMAPNIFFLHQMNQQIALQRKQDAEDSSTMIWIFAQYLRVLWSA